MRTMKYYKISPHWAEILKVTDRAVVHPDGWWMCMPAFLTRLPEELGKMGYPGLSIDDAVRHIGGCIYTQDEVIASQRGDEAYRMDREPQTSERPEEGNGTETSEDADTADGSDGTDNADVTGKEADDE